MGMPSLGIPAEIVEELPSGITPVMCPGISTRISPRIPAKVRPVISPRILSDTEIFPIFPEMPPQISARIFLSLPLEIFLGIPPAIPVVYHSWISPEM